MTDELQKLQGTWNITDLEMDGGKIAAAGLIVITGNRFVSLGAYEGTVKVDTTQTPHTIDLKFTKGIHKGKYSLGLYELKSGTWRICLGLAGMDRPKAFVTTPGSGHALEVLKREPAASKSGKATSKKKTPALQIPADFALEPAPELEGEWSMLSCVMNGDDVPYVEMGKRSAKNNQVTVTMAGQVIIKAVFTVDRSKTPKTIDYALSGGRKQFGIYDLKGTKLKTAFTAPGKERPVDFSSKRGDGKTVTVWGLDKQ